MSDKQWRWLLAVLSALLVALPLLVVTYPPSYDLPQHVAQVRLFSEALHDPNGPYRIQWLTPYSAVTALFGLIWQVATPVATGRLGLIALGLLWTGAVHWLAARRRRPAEAAVLASLLYFGLSFYRGFCSFLIGWPAFLLWFELTTQPPERFRRRHAFALLGAALLLWVCHALWFATAMGWLVVSFVLLRPPRRVLLWQLGTLLPMVVLAVVWWSTLQRSGYEVPMTWNNSPLTRLSPLWFSAAALFGLEGDTATYVFFLLLGWCGLALWQNRKELGATLDRPLTVAAACFVVGVLVLPSNVSFTLDFGERFAAPAMILVLLAMPPLRLRPVLARGAALLVLVVFCSSTAMGWVLYEKEGLGGLSTAVAALPPNARVLGLDFVRRSSYLQGWPFLHLPAYAQVEKGGRLGFSFAEMPSPLVVFKHPKQEKQWQSNLEWYADRVTPADVSHFDYLIVGVAEEKQPALATLLPVTPVTETGLWRLYKVKR